MRQWELRRELGEVAVREVGEAVVGTQERGR